MKARLLMVWLCLGMAGSVLAHRLALDWEIAGGQLAVRGLVEGAPAAGADAQLCDAEGRVLLTGVLDAEGRCRWPLPREGPVSVTVNAGLGHRRSVTLTAEELRGAGGEPSRAAAPGEASAGASNVRSGGDGPPALGGRVLLGLTFLLASAAGWMSYRNHRRLLALERRGDRHEG